MPRTRLRQREQIRTRHGASVRIVRVHQDRKIGIREFIKSARLVDRVPGKRSRTGVFRVDRPQQRRAPGWKERSHLGQQDLRAGRGDDMRTRRSAVGARRGDREPLQRARFRQPGE